MRGQDITVLCVCGLAQSGLVGGALLGWYNKEVIVRTQWTDLLSFPPGVVSRFLARQYCWRDDGEEVGVGPSLSGVLKR